MIIEWYERILWSPESDPYDVPGKILHSQQNVGFTFPMQFPPTNFLDIRIGSQLSNLDKKVRNVVPSVNGNNPILNSEINLLAYDSSSPNLPSWFWILCHLFYCCQIAKKILFHLPMQPHEQQLPN